MESPLPDPVQESNPLHYPRSTGRGLPQLRYLDIVVNVVLTNQLILHPSGLLAHPARVHLDFEARVDIALRDVFLHQKAMRLLGHRADNARHPWRVQFYYPIPTHQAHQFYLELPLDEQLTYPFYLDHS